MPYSLLQKRQGLFCIAILCLALQACGYQFSGRQSLPGGIDTIAVHVVDNRSRHTGLEATITNALVNALVHHHPGMVVKEAQAQGVLSGTIVSLKTDVISRSSPRQVVQRQVTITLSLTLKNRTGEIIWRNDRLKAKKSYGVSANAITTEARRLKAIDQAAQRLAEDAYNGIVHGF